MKLSGAAGSLNRKVYSRASNYRHSGNHYYNADVDAQMHRLIIKSYIIIYKENFWMWDFLISPKLGLLKNQYYIMTFFSSYLSLYLRLLHWYFKSRIIKILKRKRRLESIILQLFRAADECELVTPRPLHQYLPAVSAIVFNIFPYKGIELSIFYR